MIELILVGVALLLAIASVAEARKNEKTSDLLLIAAYCMTGVALLSLILGRIR